MQGKCFLEETVHLLNYFLAGIWGGVLFHMLSCFEWLDA